MTRSYGSNGDSVNTVTEKGRRLDAPEPAGFRGSERDSARSIAAPSQVPESQNRAGVGHALDAPEPGAMGLRGSPSSSNIPVSATSPDLPDELFAEDGAFFARRPVTTPPMDDLIDLDEALSFDDCDFVSDLEMDPGEWALADIDEVSPVDQWFRPVELAAPPQVDPSPTLRGPGEQGQSPRALRPVDSVNVSRILVEPGPKAAEAPVTPLAKRLRETLLGGMWRR